MKSVYTFLLVLVVGLALGCASSQDKAYQAQERVHKERLRLIDEYQKCIINAGSNKAAAEACETYLKAAEALK